MTLNQLVSRLSPKMCRILARKSRGRRPMSCDDIAKASGLSKSRVADLAKLDSWDSVPFGTLCKFAMACGVNHTKVDKQTDFVRRRAMNHIHRGTKRQRDYYARLMAA